MFNLSYTNDRFSIIYYTKIARYRLSKIYENQNTMNITLDSMQNDIQTSACEDRGKKKNNKSDRYMDFFPIQTLNKLKEVE